MGVRAIAGPAKSMEGHGVAVALTCDTCGHQTVIQGHYVKGKRGLDMKQVHNRAQRMGWVPWATKMTCQGCHAKARNTTVHIPETNHHEAEETAVTTPTNDKIAVLPQKGDAPKPTLEQRREIRKLLSDVYDDEAGRYKGRETDLTVAQTLADLKVRAGWVTSIREELFGEGGDNEETGKASQELVDLDAKLAAHIERGQELTKALEALEKELAVAKDSVRAWIGSLNIDRTAVSTNIKRVEVIKSSMGPRVGRI